ncbi:thermonuclease family protein [Methylocaldum sp. BRCS4]|jgi:endonuclease YncB( thermonuclease family)|uniref:thermonuclease family protein n=1 Tax=Methylocaldum sp. 14B TaxID=1912213 RepID=UPI00098A1115|nr:thermonuclease family protein [Methylocaldum sp. 14B]MVF23071.1 thermonuclease family protein [Methylocaldum sp. BRCS4]
MKPIRLFVALTLALPVAALSDTGKVISIQSGDRLTVRHGHQKVRIHLTGIEAPQKHQRGFGKSRAKLAKLCRNRRVHVSIDNPGPGFSDGRVACQLRGGFYADAAIYQLDQGWAWMQPNATDPDLVGAQNNAQSRCAGFWGEPFSHCTHAPSPTPPPWDDCNDHPHTATCRDDHEGDDHHF